ncbi:hypothetical protein [Aerosakkonema funiforme]|uniref:Uncharacterized protein n=1 Tax=Aerosakkonema funiforme FACHB-1375 TaxID=2949571 RepID=A0A926ZMB1_9CYAN|nr:hypothetical protein [Aerosakkonema funiforme]MBD2185916.1 hypothetical protein [Aerosakkonema funiforme FACHB-1375]
METKVSAAAFAIHCPGRSSLWLDRLHPALVYAAQTKSAYPWMFRIFEIFICAGGATDLMEIGIPKHPTYSVWGSIELITA